MPTRDAFRSSRADSSKHKIGHVFKNYNYSKKANLDTFFKNRSYAF